MIKRFYFKKGNCILVGGIWHVMVSTYYENGDIRFNCICDHANNSFNWSLQDIEEVYDLEKLGYKDPKSNRKVPYLVIAEVLSGQHDDRFDHWEEDEND